MTSNGKSSLTWYMGFHNCVYVTVWDPGSMKLWSFLEPSPCNWGTMIQSSINNMYFIVYGRLCFLYFIVPLFLNHREKVQKKLKTMGYMFYYFFWTFSPQFNNNDTIKCSSDNCSYMVTYLLLMGNFQNIISIYYGSSMVGRMS